VRRGPVTVVRTFRTHCVPCEKCEPPRHPSIQIVKFIVTLQVRHPERVFLREGSPGSGSASVFRGYSKIYLDGHLLKTQNTIPFKIFTTAGRSFAQKDALRMTLLGSYRLLAYNMFSSEYFFQ